MQVSIPSSKWIETRSKGWRRPVQMHILALLLGILTSSTVLDAQPAASAPDPNPQLVQTLLQRIERLEARVAQLEASKQPVPSPVSPQPAGQVSPPAEAPSEEVAEASPEHPEPERMDMSKTLLRIRGFGDVNLHGSDLKGTTTSFSLGQLNLFVTSDVSEKFRLLSEIVFEAGPDNVVGVDVERLLLQYSHNDYFNLSVGRFHTAIGYYNTAYHHSTWLQTTTGRPFLFQFEDGGGILPIHNVGVSVSGRIPSGRLGLNYVAEVGNGRASRSPQVEAVQNVVDENNGKAVNFALFAKPEAVRGLQVGFSAYHDGLQPANYPRISELILAAHAIIERPKFEWLNEALVIRHAPQGLTHVYDTPGFYTQFSKAFGPYRPYFRYQYVNASDSEPMFPDVGLQHGPSVGLRYDASEAVAVKLQYDYTAYRHQQAANSLALQFGFTF